MALQLQSPAWLDPVLASQDRHFTVFSPGEVVVLALSSIPQHQMTMTDIGRWILEHIPYYQTMAADFYFTHSSPPSQPTLNALYRDIAKYLYAYDIPIHQDRDGRGNNVYSITAGAAYSVLKRHIDSVGFDVVKPTTSTFPFLKLPIDLRLKVYKLALTAAGVRLKVDRTCFLGFNDKLPIWDTYVREPMAMPPPSNMLALLSVNKKISREAMFEFYKHNQFYFSDMKSLGSFLTGIGPERRKHVKNITVSYTGLTTATKATSLLLQSDVLQQLSLLVDIGVDPSNGHFVVTPGIRRYKKIENLPGLKHLQQLRGLRKLEFAPRLRHTVVKDFLSPFVFLPRGAEGPVTSTRKRAPTKRRRSVKKITAVDGEETESEHTVPKKKARRT